MFWCTCWSCLFISHLDLSIWLNNTLRLWNSYVWTKVLLILSSFVLHKLLTPQITNLPGKCRLIKNVGSCIPSSMLFWKSSWSVCGIISFSIPIKFEVGFILLLWGGYSNPFIKCMNAALLLYFVLFTFCVYMWIGIVVMRIQGHMKLR